MDRVGKGKGDGAKALEEDFSKINAMKGLLFCVSKVKGSSWGRLRTEE